VDHHLHAATSNYWKHDQAAIFPVASSVQPSANPLGDANLRRIPPSSACACPCYCRCVLRVVCCSCTLRLVRLLAIAFSFDCSCTWTCLYSFDTGAAESAARTPGTLRPSRTVRPASWRRLPAVGACYRGEPGARVAWRLRIVHRTLRQRAQKTQPAPRLSVRL
jgi:hypothetical protein